MKKISILILIMLLFNRSSLDNKVIEQFNLKNNIDILENYFMVIEIPKIKLIKELNNINSKYNNVNYNIEIIKSSIMPNIKNSTLILASHSGNSRVSYFKNLDKLKLNDIVNIYYINKKYEYEIIDFYEIDKNGTLSYKKITNQNMLILITCDKFDNTKQLVYIGILK